MISLQDLEGRLAAIEERNRMVETDKYWEGSWARRILLMAFTYASIALYFFALGLDMPFLHAVVPTLGFMLSTLTLPFFKAAWIRRFKR